MGERNRVDGENGYNIYLFFVIRTTTTAVLALLPQSKRKKKLCQQKFSMEKMLIPVKQRGKHYYTVGMCVLYKLSLVYEHLYDQRWKEWKDKKRRYMCKKTWKEASKQASSVGRLYCGVRYSVVGCLAFVFFLENFVRFCRF